MLPCSLHSFSSVIDNAVFIWISPGLNIVNICWERELKRCTALVVCESCPLTAFGEFLVIVIFKEQTLAH